MPLVYETQLSESRETQGCNISAIWGYSRPHVRILITPETLQFTWVSVRLHFTQLCTQHIKYLPQAGELRDTLPVFVLAAIIAPVKVRAAKSDRFHIIRQTCSPLCQFL